MKITIIDQVGKKAGMDYYSSSLAKGFLDSNILVSICSNFTGIQEKEIVYKNYYEGHTKSNKLYKLFKFFVSTLKSSYYAYKHKSDLVILHLFSADIVTLLLVMIPKLFGLKVAVISHDISSFADDDNRLVQNLIYNTLSDYIVVHNQFSKNELLKSIVLKDINKLRVIKHGGYLDYIDNSITKEEARKSLKLKIDVKYILFFGQIKDVKGLDILLKAMHDVPTNVKLIIAGKPWKNDFKIYSDLIKKYKLEDRIILMIRFIEDDEREKLFYASDVNILPYRIIYQSGVLLMAMSHGLPVIASNLPANKEIIVEGKNGMLFESENANSLSMKIKQFFKEDATSEKLAVNAKKTITQEYDWNDIAKEYIQLLDNDK